MDPEILLSGSRTRDGGEGWENWWLFRRLTDEQVSDILEEYDISDYYYAPGTTFARAPGVLHSRSYTLIRQEGGWDV